MTTLSRWASALLLVAFTTTGIASAQPAQIGTIEGTVRDESGAVLPGVSVTATSQRQGFSRVTTTNDAGRFRFPAVPLGSYTLTAMLAGFQTVTLVDNLVEAERTTTVSVTLSLTTVTEEVTVTGETPIVDMTNTTVMTKVRAEEFQKLPITRNYQALIGAAPGVVGTGNVNAHGALTSNNLFLFDGIDTTDPTTGTFGSNLNFETIQEVNIMTSAVSAEYGRAVGAIVNVITKSGTNRPEGSAKYIATNDDWNAQNKTRSETTGASLARDKFDQVNPVYSFTGGGPIWIDHAWFFGAYELGKNTTPQRQTVGQIPENYQQTTRAPFWLVRGTTQLLQGHNVWAKYHTSPTTGFIVDYWGVSGDRTALTRQDQGASSFGLQYSGVLRSNLIAEATFANNKEFIDVIPFEVSGLHGGAPHQNQADGRWYNGATFDGSVNRPRRQANAAVTYYARLGNNSHSFKAGFDWQKMNSSNDFKYPTNTRYIDISFDQASRTFVPLRREDYLSGPSTSSGNTYTFYIRDKFEVGKRLFFELGTRMEKQTGSSDIGVDTVDTFTVSPRLSGSYDVLGTGKTLFVGSYGRFFQGLLQNFSDNFANVPQQQNYDNFVWDGTQYVFSNSVRVGASGFMPNTSLKPMHVDEVTVGAQQQVGRVYGFGVRYVHRNWGNLIDDVRSFTPTGSVVREVVNYPHAERKYRGIEFTFDKRFANNWNAQASYTYASTRGNHHVDNFSGLGDFVDAMCSTTVDLTIGNNGVIPCREVQDGANKYGSPIFDRPHNIKLNGAYFRPIGPVNITAGAVVTGISKVTYTKNRTVSVLNPVTGLATFNATYFYEPLGSDRIPGLAWAGDMSLEGTFRALRRYEAGVKAEVFNVTNSQYKTAANNTVWCNADTPACQTTRNVYGAATARGSFLGPRTVRFTALFRF